MKPLLSLVAFFGMVGAWWFWWSHLLTWIPAALLYFPMLKKLQSDSPLMVMAAIKQKRLIGMSPEATAWLSKNAHALIMWGAATAMSRQIKLLIVFAFFGIVVTAFSHSWWWLLEFIPLSAVMISLHDGFRPLSQESLLENAASGRDPFIADEIVPLFKEIVEADIRGIMGTD
jgi:hypothetical protein